MGGKKKGESGPASSPPASSTVVPQPAPPLPRIVVHVPLWAIALSFLLPLLVYVRTAYPTVPGGDSGEVIVEAFILGNAHPPGYPFFVMLGHLVSNYLIPFGEPAWRLNVMSAAFGAAACTFLYLTGCEMALPLYWDKSNVNISNNRSNTNHADGRKGNGGEKNTAAASGANDTGTDDDGRIPAVEIDVPMWATAGSLVGAFFFSFSPLVWFYSIQAEVFALNNFFVAAVLYLTVRYLTRSERSVLLWGAFAVGVGFTNQHTLVFYAVPLVLVILAHGWRQVFTSPVMFFGVGLVGLLGMSPYAYMVWSTARNTQGSWGDCTTLEGFLIHFLRKEYGTMKLFSGDEETESLVERLVFYWADLRLQLTTPVAYASVLGCALTLVPLRTPPSSGLFGGSRVGGFARGCALLLAYAFYMIVFHALANLPLQTSSLKYGVHQRFWMQPNAIVSLWVGTLAAWGLACATDTGIVSRAIASIGTGTARGGSSSSSSSSQGSQERKRSQDDDRIGARTGSFFPAAFALAVAAVLVGRSFTTLDHSQNYQLREYGRVSLEHMPKRSLLLTHGDVITNAPRYLQQVLGVRPDIVSLNVDMATYEWWGRHHANYPGVTFPNYFYHPYKPRGFSIKQFLDANIHKFNIFVCQGFREGDLTHEAYYETIPYGLCSLVVRRGKRPPVDAWLKRQRKIFRAGLKKYIAKVDYDALDDTMWEWTTYKDFFENMDRAGYQLLMYALESTPPNATLLNATATFIERSIKENRGPIPGHTFKNLGIALTRLPDQSPRHIRERAMNAFGRYLDSPASRDDNDRQVLVEWVKHAKMSLDAEDRGERVVYANQQQKQQHPQQQQQQQQQQEKQQPKKGSKKNKGGKKKGGKGNKSKDKKKK